VELISLKSVKHLRSGQGSQASLRSDGRRAIQKCDCKLGTWDRWTAGWPVAKAPSESTRRRIWRCVKNDAIMFDGSRRLDDPAKGMICSYTTEGCIQRRRLLYNV